MLPCRAMSPRFRAACRPVRAGVIPPHPRDALRCRAPAQPSATPRRLWRLRLRALGYNGVPAPRSERGGGALREGKRLAARARRGNTRRSRLHVNEDFAEKLLLVAGVVWLAAGANIVNLGVRAYFNEPDWLLWALGLGTLVVYVLFHVFVFTKMVGKHAARIGGTRKTRPAYSSSSTRRAT